ncbi:MAG: ACT domain-containing protein [Oscillospiraceae bacterium]|nr:ACT domain-containing protein [Oscillospiraceae bacterium]
MAIRQLSVFLENKKGTLHEITDVLAKENINLRSMCIADTTDYGIVRIIADDPDKAKEVLNAAGHTASIREVTAFAVPDCPGGLAKVLSILEANGVDIEYMYALVTKSVDKAYAVARTNDDKKSEAVLKANGIEILEQTNI